MQIVSNIEMINKLTYRWDVIGRNNVSTEVVEVVDMRDMQHYSVSGISERSMGYDVKYKGRIYYMYVYPHTWRYKYQTFYIGQKLMAYTSWIDNGINPPNKMPKCFTWSDFVSNEYQTKRDYRDVENEFNILQNMRKEKQTAKNNEVSLKSTYYYNNGVRMCPKINGYLCYCGSYYVNGMPNTCPKCKIDSLNRDDILKEKLNKDYSFAPKIIELLNK